MGDAEFLLDENVLGLEGFLKHSVKYRKVGDDGCPAKEAEDPEIVKFAKEKNLVIVTKDSKMIEQCGFYDVKFVTLTDANLAKKVVDYQSQD